MFQEKAQGVPEGAPRSPPRIQPTAATAVRFSPLTKGAKPHYESSSSSSKRRRTVSGS